MPWQHQLLTGWIALLPGFRAASGEEHSEALSVPQAAAPWQEAIDEARMRRGGEAQEKGPTSARAPGASWEERSRGITRKVQAGM